MLLKEHPEVPSSEFKIGDYLTDKERLYRVEHIAPDGKFTLENCYTSYTHQANVKFVSKLVLVKKGGLTYE